MLRERIEEKLKAKTDGRIAMKEFLEKILNIEEAGKQYMHEYRNGVKNAVNKENQMGGDHAHRIY